MLPRFYVQDLLEVGRVRNLLADTPGPAIHIHAVYPRQRHLATKIRVFIDHVRAHLAREPWAKQTEISSRSRGTR